MSYQAYQNEIEIESIFLLDENGQILIDIAAENTSGKLNLDYITFNESITNPMMDGSLLFSADRGEYESLQLIGNEKIRIIGKTPVQSENDDPVTIQFPEFSVYSFEDSSNFTETSKTPEGAVQRKITLKFSSKEAKELFEQNDILPTGFIGKIVSGLTFQEGTTTDESPEVPELIDKRGLVEVVSQYFDGGIDSEPTLNDVWIRPKLVSNPNRKRLENMNLLQILNYCKDYAVSQDNPNAVNYFFWHDLAGWHFKSMDLVLYEADSKSNEELPTKSISSNIPEKNRIYKFDVISDFSEYDALSNKLIYSYYYRIEPDYISSPYARLSDDREKYNTKKIVYNYATMFDSIKRVERKSLYPIKTKEEIDLLENESLKVNDSQYGWLNDRAFNDQDSIRSIILMGNELLGISGSSGSSEEPTGEELTYYFEDEEGNSGNSGENRSYDLAHFDAYETKKWQEMFDCTSMDGAPLKKIIEEIKLPTFEAKKKYRDALAYKEQWNIYRYSVCCAQDEAEDEKSIMAVVKQARLASRNIYRYSWHEVIFIPKIELGIFMGATTEVPQPYDYDLPIETINNLNINYPFPAKFEFYKYGQKFDPEVVGDLSGEIFVGITGSSGPSGECGVTFAYTNSVTRAISDYFSLCEENSGFTMTFHNDQYSPFLILEKPNGARGSFENSSGAYNLNEILNRVVYNESTYPVVEGASLGNSLYFQSDGNGIRMPSTAPGAEDELDVLVGPGINASKQNTEYPSGFASMPVGSYQVISPRDGSESTGVVCAAIPFGFVTKISSVNIDDLPNYGIDLRKYGENGNLGGKKIYYFSATNAQDGKCGPFDDCSIGETQP